jgi:hypothetical protein
MLATHDRRIECGGIKGACVVWISAVDWLRDKSKSHPLAKCTRRLGHAGLSWECWVRERSKCGGVSPRDYGRGIVGNPGLRGSLLRSKERGHRSIRFSKLVGRHSAGVQHREPSALALAMLVSLAYDKSAYRAAPIETAICSFECKRAASSFSLLLRGRS